MYFVSYIILTVFHFSLKKTKHMKRKQFLQTTLLLIATIFISQLSFAGKKSNVVNFGRYNKGAGCAGNGVCSMSTSGSGASVTWNCNNGGGNTMNVTMTFDISSAEQYGFPRGLKSGSTYTFDGDDYTFTGNEGTCVPQGYVLASGTVANYTISGRNGTLSFSVSNGSGGNGGNGHHKKGGHKK